MLRSLEHAPLKARRPRPLGKIIERGLDVDAVARVLVRAERPGKAVRVNITLDEGLLSQINRVALNRSGFLADVAGAG